MANSLLVSCNLAMQTVIKSYDLRSLAIIVEVPKLSHAQVWISYVFLLYSVMLRIFAALHYQISPCLLIKTIDLSDFVRSTFQIKTAVSDPDVKLLVKLALSRGEVTSYRALPD